MKKIYFIIAGLILSFTILLGWKMPVNAASYKAQLILDSYELPEDYQIGEDTTIKVTFKNVDASYNVRNILISYTSNGYTVIPVECKANQFYYDTIRPNDSITVDMPIVVTHAEGGYASMSFSIEYLSDDSRWNTSCFIVFPVKEEETASIVLKNVNVPAEVTAGGNVLISTSFLNTSESDMFNTTFVINGDISDGIKEANLGTVATRRNAYGEVYVSFAEAGKKSIDLSIRYEDANGEIHEETIGQYSINVKEDGSTKVNTTVPSDTGTVTPPSANNGGGANISIATLLLIASGVIVLIIIVVVIINVTRKRK